MVCVLGEEPIDSGVDVEATTDVGPRDSSLDAPTDALSPDVDMSDAGPSAPPPPMGTTCWARGGTRCDWSVTGFRLEPVSTNNFTNPLAGNVDFSPDGCSIYYSEQTPDHQIYRVDRGGPGMPFGEPILEDGVNSMDSDEDGPSLGPNRRELFFASNRGDSELRRVHRAERASISLPWEMPVPIPSLDIRGSTGWEPRVAPHGLRLYVALSVAQQWVHVVERSELDGEFGPPLRLAMVGIDDLWSTNRPSVTHDDTVMAFVAQPPLSGSGDRLGYYMTRDHWREPWSAAQRIPETWATLGGRDFGISADGCELVVRSGSYEEARQTILKYVDP